MGSSSAKIESQITSRIVEAHVNDDLAQTLSGQFQFFFELPLLLPYLRFINGIVREKERRIREGMKIMGLKNSAFYFSWLITYFLIFTIISIFSSAILVGGFFQHTGFGWVFLWHWEFVLCLMALGFFITVPFSKAKQANIAGFLIAFLFQFFGALNNSGNASSMQLLGMSFAPQTSLQLSGSQLIILDSIGLGLNKETVSLEVQGYKMTYHYIIMLLDTLIFIISGIYLDQILPSEFGIRKHPLFCLLRNKSSRKLTRAKDEETKRILEMSGNFEDVDSNSQAQDELNESIMVKKLRKVFSNKKVAVDDVSFNMYKSQIFALLGHNGAGKTTTISMITGLFEATEGSTKVFGMDVVEKLEEVRKIMGVCPQHDILFDDLTVKEHLELFAVFKGVNKKDIPQEVDKIIEDIDLTEKRNYLSKNLSGGQKRKLSIGIAFIGGSKFILLDEPSSGMDTSARRKLWDMLKNYKSDRVVLLTTHFMDEADYLGDRIGIMGDGKLKCLGRPLFLKNKFGVGYNLTLVKKDINDPSEPIKKLVKKHVPQAIVSSDVSAEVALQLPLEAAGNFKNMFDEIDSKLAELNLSSYGISVTTLEEVFLNVAKVTTPEKHYQKKITPELTPQDDLNGFDLRKEKMQGSWKIFKTHFAALVRKRVQYFKRDKKGLCCELFLPVLMILVGVLIGKGGFIKTPVPLPIVDDLYDYRLKVAYNPNVQTGGGPTDITFLPDYFNTNDFEFVQKDLTDVNSFNKAVYEMQGKDIVRSPVNVFSFYTTTFDETAQSYKYTAFVDSRAQEGSTFAMNKINNAIFKRATGISKAGIDVVVYPFGKTKGTGVLENILDGLTYSFVFSIGMSFIPASVITFIVKERELNVKHQQLVSGVSLTGYWFANYVVDMLKYMVPGVINSLIAMAFHPTALVEGEKLGAVWCIFIFYGFGITSFVYLTSFLFKDYGTAQIVSFFFNFGSGFIGGLIVSILRLIKSTKPIAEVLQWILRPLPTFSMTYGFLNLAK